MQDVPARVPCRLGEGESGGGARTPRSVQGDHGEPPREGGRGREGCQAKTISGVLQSGRGRAPVEASRANAGGKRCSPRTRTPVQRRSGRSSCSRPSGGAATCESALVPESSCHGKQSARPSAWTASGSFQRTTTRSQSRMSQLATRTCWSSSAASGRRRSTCRRSITGCRAGPGPT